MSRIGNKVIVVPAGVEVKNDNNTVTVKGPKGTLTQTLSSEMSIEMNGSEITVSRPSDKKDHRALHGLTRTLLANMVEGVTDGYVKELEINGVGYRAAKQGNKLVLSLGYSHPVEMVAPEGVYVEVPSQTSIKISGYDKQKVGQFAAEVREKRPPEPYKGKGIKYVGEVIIRKEGKAGKAAK